MIEIGQEYQIYIRDMSVDMEGIGEFEGRVFFVKDAIFGQVCIAKVTEIKKNIVFATSTKIEKQSPYYVSENDNAGGCMYSSLSYEGQLLLKENFVRNTIQRISKISEDKVKNIISPDILKNYRNSTTFFVDDRKKKCGFYILNTNEIVEVEECLIHSDVAMVVYKYVRENLIGRGIKSVNVRVSQATKEVMIVFSILKDSNFLIEHIEKLDEIVASLGFFLESIYELKKAPKLIAGKPTILDKIGDTSYEVGARSFRQINSYFTAVMYDKIKKMVEDIDLEDKYLIDMYCGAGSIGLYLKDSVKQFVGVDSSQENIFLANRNATINKSINSYFIRGKSEDILSKYLKANLEEVESINLKSSIEVIKKANIVILDPARKGCDKLLITTLGESDINNIIYLSCNPATLARDLKEFGEVGFNVASIEPMDNFPFTNHVECVVLMSRGVIISKLAGIQGVWSLFGKKDNNWYCLQVAQTQDIKEEIEADKELIENDKELIENDNLIDETNEKWYINQFKEKVFKYKTVHSSREYLYSKFIRHNFSEFKYIFVKEETNEKERLKIEKDFATAHHAICWRNGRPFVDGKMISYERRDNENNYILNHATKVITF